MDNRKRKPTIVRKGRATGRQDIDLLITKALRKRVSASMKPAKLYASNAGFCPRRAVKFFEATGDVAMTAKSAAYMKIGVAIHELIASGLKRAGLLLSEEYRLPRRTRPPDIRGIVDVFYLSPADEVMGMEIKSCGAMPSSPKLEYIRQAQIYSALTGVKMIITYLSRNVADRNQKLLIRSFDVDCSKQALLNTLTGVCSAHISWSKGRLPQIPLGFSAERECRWCAFKHQCWGSEDNMLPEFSPRNLAVLMKKARNMAEDVFSERENSYNVILKTLASGSLQAAERLRNLL